MSAIESDTVSLSDEHFPVEPVASFAPLWRRGAAFALDYAILCLPVFAAGFLFFDEMTALGEWGRLVGLILFCAYFAPFDSVAGGGATPGKRLLGIRVVNADGNAASLGRTFPRTVVLGVALTLNGLWLPESDAPEILLLGLNLIIFFSYAALVYLFLCNRGTRQSLHDLISGTYVVRKPSGRVPRTTFRKVHLLILGCVGLGLTGALLYFNVLATATVGPAIEEMRDLTHDLSGELPVQRAAVSQGSTERNTANGTTTTTNTSLFLLVPRSPEAPYALAARAAALVDKYPLLSEPDIIFVRIQQGYQFGIFHAEVHLDLKFPPSIWRANPDMPPPGHSILSFPHL